METPSLDKLKQSRAWTDYAMRNSPRWREFLYASVMYAEKSKVFAVWDYSGAGPTLVTALIVEDVSISFDRGVTVKLYDVVDESHVVIEHTPSQVVPGVFMWVPQFMDMRYTPELYADSRGPWQLHLPICVKTATHPTKALTPGHRYISTQRDFESRWPQHK